MRCLVPSSSVNSTEENLRHLLESLSVQSSLCLKWVGRILGALQFLLGFGPPHFAFTPNCHFCYGVGFF